MSICCKPARFDLARFNCYCRSFDINVKSALHVAQVMREGGREGGVKLNEFGT